MGAKPPGFIPDKLLGCQPAGPLDKTTLDLADIDGLVQRAPHIMQDIGAKDAVLAGQKVGRHFGHRRAIGVIIERATAASHLVPMDFRRCVETCR